MTRASEIETNQSTLDEIVQRIVDGFNPQRIILFGSWARGSAGPDSDVDLLIVMEVEGSKRKKATEIDIALVGVPVPIDLIVVTPSDVERSIDSLGSIVASAFREGKVLYERAA
ncbi:MAG: nucleotidyltransferase domain-containing protein [Thermoleophilia bacterium]